MIHVHTPACLYHMPEYPDDHLYVDTVEICQGPLGAHPSLSAIRGSRGNRDGLCGASRRNISIPSSLNSLFFFLSVYILFIYE